MEVYRISSSKYSKSLVASRVSSRWNKDNEYVLYASQSRSLAALENRAHLSVFPAIAFEIVVISIPDDKRFFKRVDLKSLPFDWNDVVNYSAMQEIGSKWYTQNESLVLQVPSAIIPQEFNFVINTKHPDFSHKSIALLKNEDYFWDARLFSK